MRKTQIKNRLTESESDFFAGQEQEQEERRREEATSLKLKHAKDPAKPGPRECVS